MFQLITVGHWLQDVNFDESAIVTSISYSGSDISHRVVSLERIKNETTHRKLCIRVYVAYDCKTKINFVLINIFV